MVILGLQGHLGVQISCYLIKFSIGSHKELIPPFLLLFGSLTLIEFVDGIDHRNCFWVQGYMELVLTYGRLEHFHPFS